MLSGKSSKKLIGSGIVISKDGYIVTNLHVIDGAKIIEVELDDGQVYLATLIGFDERSDLAVIKIQPIDDLQPIESSNSSSVQIGDQVIAIGNAFGLGKLLLAELSALLEEIMGIHILNLFKLMQPSIQVILAEL